MRKDKLFWVNILLLAGAMGCLICYDHFRGLWLKGVTSSWFVVLGAVNLFACPGKKRSFSVLMVLGLICSMLADVLLGVAFYAGVAVFALGHVLYLAAVSIFVVVGTPWIRVEDPMMRKLLLGYALIISAMLGKAWSNLSVCKCNYRWVMAVGCMMFWFSDLMLAIDLFGQPSRLVWILCSYSYWPAQNLLAHSLYHAKRSDL